MPILKGFELADNAVVASDYQERRATWRLAMPAVGLQKCDCASQTGSISRTAVPSLALSRTGMNRASITLMPERTSRTICGPAASNTAAGRVCRPSYWPPVKLRAACQSSISTMSFLRPSSIQERRGAGYSVLRGYSAHTDAQRGSSLAGNMPSPKLRL